MKSAKRKPSKPILPFEPHRKAERTELICSLFRQGILISDIATECCVSKQRISQILKKNGLSAADGGQSARKKMNAVRRLEDRNNRCLRVHGCTLTQYSEIDDMRLRMLSEGKSKEVTPNAAYNTQKQNAIKRGVPWEISLWDWWVIWRDSNHWHQRGVFNGCYVMCRVNDEGPYAVGNVFIDTQFNNLSQTSHHTSGLPLGVDYRPRNSKRSYVARINVGGKQRYLGCFKTPEQAHAAYVQASIAS